LFGYAREFPDERIEARAVLQVISGDGEVLLPSFQLDGRGGFTRRMVKMLEAIDPDSRDLWGDAMWLNAPEKGLDEGTWIDKL
jgi:hypothetical protein